MIHSLSIHAKYNQICNESPHLCIETNPAMSVQHSPLCYLICSTILWSMVVHGKYPCALHTGSATTYGHIDRPVDVSHENSERSRKVREFPTWYWKPAWKLTVLVCYIKYTHMLPTKSLSLAARPYHLAPFKAQKLRLCFTQAFKRQLAADLAKMPPGNCKAFHQCQGRIWRCYPTSIASRKWWQSISANLASKIAYLRQPCECPRSPRIFPIIIHRDTNVYTNHVNQKRSSSLLYLSICSDYN